MQKKTENRVNRLQAGFTVMNKTNELHQWSEVVSDTGVDGRVIKFIIYQKFKVLSQKI